MGNLLILVFYLKHIYKSLVSFFQNLKLYDHNILTLRVFQNIIFIFQSIPIHNFFIAFEFIFNLYQDYHDLVAFKFLRSVRSIIKKVHSLLMLVKFLSCITRFILCSVAGNWQSNRSKKRISSPPKGSLGLSKICCITKLGIYVPSDRRKAQTRYQ